MKNNNELNKEKGLTPEETKKARNKKQNRIALWILIVGTLLAFIIFGPEKEEVEETQEVSVTAVKTMEMGSENSKFAILRKTIFLSSSKSADAIAEYTGRVTEVNFREGDYVGKGKVLVVFDQSSNNNSPKVSFESSTKNLKVAQDNLDKTKDATEEGLELAKNARKIAEIQLDQAKDSGDADAEELAERNLENAKDLEDQAELQAEIQVNNTQLAVNQAEEAVRQSSIAYEKTFIKAPISGTISSKSVNNNDFVSVGQQVAQIVGNDQVESKVFLNEDESKRVQEGDEIEIWRDNEMFKGKIDALSSIANADNNRSEVVINSDEELTSEANRSASVVFRLRLDPGNQGSFFIPLSAVKIGQQKNIVFIFEEGRTKLVEVKIGQVVGDQIEILEGLNEGDHLIVENNRNLRDEQEVKVE